MSQIEILKWTPKESGALKGYANIYVPKFGIEIFGVKLFEKNNYKWVTMPANAVEKDGETKYFPHIRFREKETMEKFSKVCADEIHKFKSTQSKSQSYDEECPF